MGDADRPSFSRQQAASIEQALNDLDGAYWVLLRPFLGRVLPEESYDRRATGPPKPKESAKLILMFADYAGHLFAAEAGFYPDRPQLRGWLENLKSRIHDRISDTVQSLEEDGRPRGLSLSYHGVTAKDLRAAVEDELDGQIKKRLAPPPQKPPLSPEVQAQMDAPHPPAYKAQIEQPAPANESEIERRAKLLADYKQKTGASNRQIFLGNSGIYAPEFRDWIKGKLKSSSATAINFERFLREQRLPTPRNPKK
jgi:hypothetical protein